MYTAMLYLHSYLRWAVLLLGIYLVVRAWLARRDNGWEPLPARLKIFVLLFDIQAAVGVLLYAFFSPMVQSSMQDFGRAMQTPALRYWAVEHPTIMLISLILAHVAFFKVKRNAYPGAQRRAVLIYLGIAVLLLLVLMPWPFAPAHRPLIRF